MNDDQSGRWTDERGIVRSSWLIFLSLQLNYYEHLDSEHDTLTPRTPPTFFALFSIHCDHCDLDHIVRHARFVF